MRSLTYLFGGTLALATLLLASDAPAPETATPLQVVKIVKHASSGQNAKNQPGPADRPKEKAYDSLRMQAQPHLKPKALHIPKEEDEDEK